MPAPQPGRRGTMTENRPAVAGWPVSRPLLILAFVFFLGATLLAAGIITGAGLTWLLPAGLATLTLAFIVPLAAPVRPPPLVLLLRQQHRPVIRPVRHPPELARRVPVLLKPVVRLILADAVGVVLVLEVAAVGERHLAAGALDDDLEGGDLGCPRAHHQAVLVPSAWAGHQNTDG